MACQGSGDRNNWFGWHVQWLRQRESSAHGQDPGWCITAITQFHELRKAVYSGKITVRTGWWGQQQTGLGVRGWSGHPALCGSPGILRRKSTAETRYGAQAGVYDSVRDEHCRTLVGWNQSRVCVGQVDPGNAWTAPLDQSHLTRQACLAAWRISWRAWRNETRALGRNWLWEHGNCFPVAAGRRRAAAEFQGAVCSGAPTKSTHRRCTNPAALASLYQPHEWSVLPATICTFSSFALCEGSGGEGASSGTESRGCIVARGSEHAGPGTDHGVRRAVAGAVHPQVSEIMARSSAQRREKVARLKRVCVQRCVVRHAL